MFSFCDEFDVIKSNELELRIIEKFPGDEVLIPFYYYDIYLGEEAIGKISIRIGNNYHSYYNGHIGYEIDEAFRGHQYSLKAAHMVLPVAKYHGMQSLYLSCDKSNMASRTVIERLGARLVEETVPPKDYFAWQEGMEVQRIYQLTL